MDKHASMRAGMAHVKYHVRAIGLRRVAVCLAGKPPERLLAVALASDVQSKIKSVFGVYRSKEARTVHSP